jgi:hypothetical protein
MFKLCPNLGHESKGGKMRINKEGELGRIEKPSTPGAKSNACSVFYHMGYRYTNPICSVILLEKNVCTR